MTPAAIVNVADRPASYQVMTLPELVEQIVLNLPNMGYTAVARGISSLWYTICTEELKTAFDIDDILGQYFSDSGIFRQLQRELDMVVSGPVVLSIFRRFNDRGHRTTTDSTLELYVDLFKFNAIRAFLHHEGYRLRTLYHIPGLPVQSVYALSNAREDSVESVFHFVKADLLVDVVCTVATPLYCIFGFDSTIAMNFITWNKAYCLWPKATLLEGRGVLLRRRPIQTTHLSIQYEKCGFEILRWRDTTLNGLYDSLSPGMRWVADTRCWVVDLNTVSDKLHSRCYWGVSVVSPLTCQYDTNGLDFDYMVVQGPSLTKSGCLWAVLPQHGCCLLDHRALVGSYALPRCFYLAMSSYIKQLVHTQGVLGSGQSVNELVDTTLRELKRMHSHEEYSLATPLVLYQ